MSILDPGITLTEKPMQSNIAVQLQLDAARTEMIKRLQAAQLRVFPDSRFLTPSEVIREWLNFERIPYQKTFEEWSQQAHTLLMLRTPEGKPLPKAEVLRHYNQYVLTTRYAHETQVLRGLVMGLQYPVLVFYECGKQKDGSYQWRGARYGLEGNEYLSNLL